MPKQSKTPNQQMSAVYSENYKASGWAPDGQMKQGGIYQAPSMPMMYSGDSGASDAEALGKALGVATKATGSAAQYYTEDDRRFKEAEAGTRFEKFKSDVARAMLDNDNFSKLEDVEGEAQYTKTINDLSAKHFEGVDERTMKYMQPRIAAVHGGYLEKFLVARHDYKKEVTLSGAASTAYDFIQSSLAAIPAKGELSDEQANFMRYTTNKISSELIKNAFGLTKEDFAKVFVPQLASAAEEASQQGDITKARNIIKIMKANDSGMSWHTMTDKNGKFLYKDEIETAERRIEQDYDKFITRRNQEREKVIKNNGAMLEASVWDVTNPAEFTQIENRARATFKSGAIDATHYNHIMDSVRKAQNGEFNIRENPNEVAALRSKAIKGELTYDQILDLKLKNHITSDTHKELVKITGDVSSKSSVMRDPDVKANWEYLRTAMKVNDAALIAQNKYDEISLNNSIVAQAELEFYYRMKNRKEGESPYDITKSILQKFGRDPGEVLKKNSDDKIRGTIKKDEPALARQLSETQDPELVKKWWNVIKDVNDK